jgi:type IV pilus assembly protein PilM
MSPQTRRILSLNLGTHTIGLAEFHALPKGGLALTGYRLREILVEPSNESARNAQIAVLVRGMLDELGIKGGPVNYATAAQSVFARFVELPAVEEEKIERIIAFEAQQNVPFPIDEVVWDYQLVGGGAGEQIQVVLVAIKEDLLERVNAAVESTGLRTSIVCVAMMALYNAFRYSYGDLPGCSLRANFFPKRGHRRRLGFIGDRQGVRRAVRRGRVPEKTPRLRWLRYRYDRIW